MFSGQQFVFSSRQKFGLLLMVVALFSASGCSREKTLSEDLSLRNYRILALPLLQKPQNVAGFLDSLERVDTVRIADTLTLTVGDTVWMLGHFRGRQKNVRSHFWNIHFGEPKIVPNDTVFPVVFDTTGVFRYWFVVVDNIGGRDTAGLNQRIRVINTSPQIDLAQDTLWSRVAGGAMLRFAVNDSFGSVREVRLHWNRDGLPDSVFRNPVSWVELRIPADTASMVGRLQQVIIEVEDEDGNITRDTTFIHFNFPPQVRLNFPLEGSRVDIFSRFSFHYHAEDRDNPQDIRYFLRVGPGLVLTNSHLVVSNTANRSWEAIGSDSVRYIDSSLTGRIFWQVWATDGFDTSYSEVRSFWLGDPRVRFGSIRGRALLEGIADDHRGLRVTLVRMQTDPYRYHTETDREGNWIVRDVEPGWYSVEVRDTLGTGYPMVRRDSLLVELAEETNAGELVLRDRIPPRIFMSSLPPPVLRGRNILLSGIFTDSGSQVHTSSIQAWHNGNPISGTWNSFNWQVNLTGLRNGSHEFRIRAADRAGNRSDTLTLVFHVDNKEMNLLVNGEAAAIVKISVPLDFSAEVSGAQPGIQAFLWDYNGDGIWDDTTAATNSMGNYSRIFTQPVAAGRMIALAVDSLGFSIRDTVQFVVVATNNPAVLFTKPAQDTVLTPQDSIFFRVVAVDPDGFIVSIEWDADGNGTWDLSGDSSQLTLGRRFSGPGVYRVGVRVTDDDGLVDSIYRQITVISDPPQVRVTNDSMVAKINAQISLGATVTDRGSIVRYEWRCGSEPFAEYPGPAITIISPSQAAENWRCIVRVTDDDGEQAMDTTIVRVVQGIPTVRVNRKNFTVTIRDTIALQAVAHDPAGFIMQTEWSCGLPGTAGVGFWNPVSRPDTQIVVPATAHDLWLCVIRVTDDDGQSARDSVQFRIILDNPQVQVVDDSLTVRINQTVGLDAIALDSAGRIVRHEWSCGGPGNAGVLGWVVVSRPDTLWRAPAVGQHNWMCVIRVTDDDGLTARDTIRIRVIQDEPQVVVGQEYLEVRIGDVYDLTATASDAMGTIILNEWSCGLPGTAGTPGNWTPTPTANFTTIAPMVVAPQYMCIIRVTDNDEQTVRDTTHMQIFRPPQAILVTPDSLPLWSGDREIPTQFSHYNHLVNGTSSVIGTFGSNSGRQFWWNFSHLFSGQLFEGESDGTINIGYFEFDTAFTRPTLPMDFTLRMEFRDSIIETGEQDSAALARFFYRHASLDERTIRFRQFWQRQGSDTVVVSGARGRVGVVVDATGAPLLAHRDATGAGFVRRFSGGTWNVVGGGAFASSADSLVLRRDATNGNIFVGFIDNAGAVIVRFLAGGSGNWQTLGAAAVVPGVVMDFDLQIVNGVGPLLSWIASDTIGRAMLHTSAVGWGWNGVGNAQGAATNNVTVRRLRSAVSSGGDSIYFAFIRNDNQNPHLRSYRRSNNSWTNHGAAISAAARGISVAVIPNGDVFLSFGWVDSLGRLTVRRRSGSTWFQHGQRFLSRRPIGISTTLISDNSGSLVVAYEDPPAVMPLNANISVYRFAGAEWRLMGENLLPHFDQVFFRQRGYFLYALSPVLSMAPDGGVFLAMICRDTRGTHSGPMVMRHPGNNIP